MSSKMYVSSVTYPLGDDDPDNRTDYRKFVVLNALLQGRDVSGSITNAYLKGQGIKLRNAYNYARDHFFFGVPWSGARYINSPDKEYIASVLQLKYPGREILLNKVRVTTADFVYWAQRWLADNYGYDQIAGRFLRPPPGVEATATVTYDWDMNGNINILLMNAGGATTALSFHPKDLASQHIYAHVVYQVVTPFPTETTKWSRAAEPGEIDSISNVVVITENVTETKEVITVTDGNVDGAVVNFTRTVTTRVLSRPKYWLYELGAGDYPIIDAWVSNPTYAASPYYPNMPLRINNANVISEGNWPKHPLVITGKKLFNKIGVDIEKLNDQLLDNDQINEIDFAYVAIAVAVNSKTPECKKYIYRFIEYLRSLSTYTKAEFDAWVVRYNRIALEMAAETVGGEGDVGGGMPSPGAGSNPDIGYETPQRNALHIFHPNTSEALALNYEYQWNWINTTTHAGKIQGHPNAKPGDCEVFTRGGLVQFLYAAEMIVDGSSLVAQRQIDADTYEEIEICGFVHLNHIYNGKFVFTTAYDAFNEPDEEGFIIPLNVEMLRDMSIPDVTQMAYDCCHMVLNCYKVVKKKWYQSGWFAVLLIIVAIVLLVVTWGQSAPASNSLIGMALAILGGGLIAMIIVATVTVLVGMFLMKILSPVFIDIFGPVWGPVILAIAMMITMNWATTGQFFSGSAAMLQINAQTLIQGSIAALNTYGQIMQAKLGQLDVPGQIEALKSEYEARMDEIKKLTKENLGTSTDILDLDGYLRASAVMMEGPDSFFRRTLMTGDDICMITQNLIESFTEVGLALPTTP